MAEIGEFVEVVSGPAFKSSRFTDDPSDVPLIKGENIAQGHIAWEKSRYWPVTEAEEYERFRLAAGDIVLAMDRPWVTAGLKWARLRPHDPPSLLVQRVARLRAKPGLRQDFLTHVIGSSAFSEYVRHIMGGTNVPHISGSQIKAFRFRLLEETEQAAIESTLSAYDDLIENNRRRIALLEQAARLFFREWFVHFRFPGHEHIKMIDGLPEGWLRRTVYEVAHVMSGGTPKTSIPSYWDGGIPFYTPRDSTDYVYAYETERTLTEEGLQSCNSTLYPKNTIFIGARGSVGKINLAQTAMAMNQTCYALLAKNESRQTFLYFALAERVTELKAHAVGSVFDAIIVDTFKRLPFIEPPNSLTTEFTSLATPLVNQIDNLATQNRALAQARDLLLPRLMSGEIAV